MCRFLLAGLIIIFNLSISDAFSQNAMPKEAHKLLDSALSAGDMSEIDLWMPNDYIDINANTLNSIKDLFEKPLNTFDAVEKYASRLKLIHSGIFNELASKVMRDLQFSDLNIIEFDNNYPVDRINKDLGFNTDSAANFLTALVFRQYAAPLIQFNSILNKNISKKDKESIEFLQRYADTVLLYPVASSSANFTDRYKTQLRQESISEELNKSANVYINSQIYSMAFSLYKKYLDNIAQNAKTYNMLKENVKTLIINTKYGKMAIGGAEDNVYEGDFVLIIDFGGNDKYFLKDMSKKEALSKQARIIIDFDGDDIYSGGNYSLGGASFGTNILIDLNGNDTYTSKDVSLGSALFGVGILHDFAGNDKYLGGSHTQGAGAFGIGLLIDGSGNDLYYSSTYSQGFGYTLGFGALSDASGNDNYVSNSQIVDVLRYDNKYLSFSQGAATGERNIAGGGIGILQDLAGNDTYKCDIFGQGCAYWFSLAGLIDEEGDDSYIGGQYVQGSGVHLAFALLNDKNGNDSYISHSVSQGCGHDIAFGCLLDENGNDRYSAESLSQGGGNANAVSILIDIKGKDSYFAQNLDNSQGWSDFRRAYGMPGIFIDGEGLDNYSSFNSNDIEDFKGTYGVFYDANSNEPVGRPNGTNEESNIKPRSNSIDELFLEASADLLIDQPYVYPAKKAIANLKAKAADFLLPKFGTLQPRQALAVEDIMNLMFEIDSSIVIETVIEALESKNPRIVNMAMRIAGKNKMIILEDNISDKSKNADWRVRETAALTLGDINSSKHLTALESLLKDPNSIVRAKAAYSIARICPDNVLTLLAPAFKDNFKRVKANAVNPINNKKSLSQEFLFILLQQDTPTELQILFAPSVGKADISKSDLKKIKLQVMKLSNAVKEHVYLSILKSDNELWKDISKDLQKNEKNPELKLLLNNANR